MDTRVAFENYSYDLGRAEVVFFQHDPRIEGEAPVVWKIIRHCGYECTHPFRFSTEPQVGIVDPWGNILKEPQLSGHGLVTVSRDAAGRTVVHARPTAFGGIRVSNGLDVGTLTVYLARNGRAVTPRRPLAPGTSTLFNLGSELRVVAHSGLEVGEAVPRAALAGPHGPAAFDLRGMSHVRLLMMGGGWGAGASALRFTLYKPVYGAFAP